MTHATVFEIAVCCVFQGFGGPSLTLAATDLFKLWNVKSFADCVHVLILDKSLMFQRIHMNTYAACPHCGNRFPLQRLSSTPTTLWQIDPYQYFSNNTWVQIEAFSRQYVASYAGTITFRRQPAPWTAFVYNLIHCPLSLLLDCPLLTLEKCAAQIVLCDEAHALLKYPELPQSTMHVHCLHMMRQERIFVFIWDWIDRNDRPLIRLSSKYVIDRL